MAAVVIGATNRKQDLDAALLSRFSAIITFDLPDQDCRCEGYAMSSAQALVLQGSLALQHAASKHWLQWSPSRGQFS